VKRLRELRELKKITQQQVADYINKTFQAYSLYENGKRDPDTETLAKLSQYFNVSTDYLLGLTDDPQSATNKNEKENTTMTFTRFAALPFRRKIEALRKEQRLSIEDMGEKIFGGTEISPATYGEIETIYNEEYISFEFNPIELNRRKKAIEIIKKFYPNESFKPYPEKGMTVGSQEYADNFIYRLRGALAEKNATTASIADAFGLDTASIESWVSGERKVDPYWLDALNYYLGADLTKDYSVDKSAAKKEVNESA
jgi:transcriptional regulator with XRE-family HTH domain